MDIQNYTNNKTAIQDEQQSKSKKEIIDDIIYILANNNLTISDSKDILYETTKVVCRQKIQSPSTSHE